MASHNDEYELFEYRHVTMGKAPMITLQKRGTFSLNRTAYEQLGSPEHIQLLYNRKRNRVGFQVAAADAPHAYSLSPQASNSNYQIGARSFCLYYNIPIGDGSKRFNATLEGDILSIDLDQDIHTIRSAPRRNTRAAQTNAAHEAGTEHQTIAVGR